MWDSNSIFHPLEISKQDSASSQFVRQDGFQWVRSYLNEYSDLAFRLQESSSGELSVLLVPGIGMSAQSGPARSYKKLALQPFIWSEARFQNNWYAQLYIRATNEPASLPHYSGISRDIARAGMHTGEIDQSIIGYQNKWANIEYGRSREIWGPSANDNLLLSGNSPAYERLALQFSYRRFTCRWFYGFLEALRDDDNTQRYIVGRALEYRNRKNLVVGMGEVSILVGPNRPLDMAFLNPLAIHIEIEQNRRTNKMGNYQNAILFLHVDWFGFQSLRLSGLVLIDEIKLERQEIQEGKPDRLGWFGRIAWTPYSDRLGVTLYTHFIKIDTETMQHARGTLNFVTRSQLIGHPLGNDAEQVAAGLKFSNFLPVLLGFEYGQIRWGDSSIRYDPYRSLKEIDGVAVRDRQILTNKYLSVSLNSQLLKGLSVNIEGHLDIEHSGENSALEVWTFSARYQIPFLITKI